MFIIEWKIKRVMENIGIVGKQIHKWMMWYRSIVEYFQGINMTSCFDVDLFLNVFRQRHNENTSDCDCDVTHPIVTVTSNIRSWLWRQTANRDSDVKHLIVTVTSSIQLWQWRHTIKHACVNSIYNFNLVYLLNYQIVCAETHPNSEPRVPSKHDWGQAGINGGRETV